MHLASTSRPRLRARSLAVALPLLATLATTPGCGGAEEEGPHRPRLVVLYTTCTLSKDFLSPYAPEMAFTPHLQAFADDSLVFDRHSTETGQSGVAFASIYTGLQADGHGVYHHPREIAESVYQVSEAYRDAGYETHFWSGQSMAAYELGYAQGVDPERVYHTHVMFTKHAKKLGEEFFVNATANGPELHAVLDRLKEDPSAREFLQINFTITHELYHEYADMEKIQAFRARYPEHATELSRAEIAETLAFFEENRHALQLNHPAAVERLGMTAEDVARLDEVLQLAYKACVAQLDEYFGRFVDSIRDAGVLDDTLFVFTADHGETFYHESEPFHWMHGLQLAPSVIDVPLFVRAPSLDVKPGRYEGVTRSIDVFPTMAGLCRLPLPIGTELEGADLSGAVLGQRQPPDLIAFSHTSTLGEDRVRRYKREGHTVATTILPEASVEHVWVRARQGDMVFENRQVAPGKMATVAFDLSRDRWRTHDVFDLSNAEHAKMQERLQLYRKRLTRAFDPNETMDQKDILGLLKGLGYVGGDE